MKKKILIVDDDTITLKILKKNLEESFEVLTESSGHRFVERMDLYDVDLILLDVEMPIVNGIQAFEEVLRNPRLRNVPVAFLSGVVNPDTIRELVAKGAAGYLIKTTPQSELIEKVKKLIESGSIRDYSPEILILEGNITKLKSMRNVLSNDVYTVKTARNIIDAVDMLGMSNPDLLIIGNDFMGTKARDIYEQLTDIIRSKSMRTMILDKEYFDSELLDSVRDCLK